jgi:hypothetical protein
MILGAASLLLRREGGGFLFSAICKLKEDIVRRVVLRIVTLALCLSSALPALAQPGQTSEAALKWLATKQNADGGFSTGFAPGSDIGATADAILAITAAGQDASTWRQGDTSPLDYLAAQVRAGSVKGAGVAAKVALAAVATGQDPNRFAGTDLIALIAADANSSTHIYGGGMFDHALALLAFANAGQPLPAAAVTALADGQADDGAWSFTGDTTPGAGDTNTTAMAAQALIAGGRRGPVAKALEYFRQVQNADGGFTYQKPSQFGEDTDANSTALVIQALLAAGEDLDSWQVDGDSPLDALLALQRPSGAFSFNAPQADDSILATLQALPALNGVTYVALREVRAANPPQTAPAQATAMPTPAPTATGAPATLPTTGGDAMTEGRWAVAAGIGLVLIVLGALGTLGYGRARTHL